MSCRNGKAQTCVLWANSPNYHASWLNIFLQFNYFCSLILEWILLCLLRLVQLLFFQQASLQPWDIYIPTIFTTVLQRGDAAQYFFKHFFKHSVVAKHTAVHICMDTHTRTVYILHITFLETCTKRLFCDRLIKHLLESWSVDWQTLSVYLGWWESS